MVHESQLHDENSFLTLTYNPEHLPVNGNLDYRAVTLFIKRLRKVLNSTSYNGKLKYYLCGEYGENFSRPHYHVILFGFNFTAKIRYKGKENSVESLSPELYSSTFLTDLWDQGHCSIGNVSYQSCMYVAKYVTKKVTGRNKDSHYQRILDDGEIISVEPEQARMSRKNAIGKEWIQKFTSDVFPRDHVIHEAKRLKTPAYYDKWLEKNNPQLFEQVKQQREASVLDLQQKTQEDLTRIHEVKILNAKNNPRVLEGQSKTNLYDELLLSYSKEEKQRWHFQQKAIK